MQFFGDQFAGMQTSRSRSQQLAYPLHQQPVSPVGKDRERNGVLKHLVQSPVVAANG